MFWICSEHSADNTEMFLSLLSRAYAEPFLLLGLSYWLVRGTGSWDETQMRLVTPIDHRDVPFHMTLHSVHKVEGEKRKRAGGLESLLHVMEPCFPECDLPSLGKKNINSLFCFA